MNATKQFAALLIVALAAAVCGRDQDRSIKDRLRASEPLTEDDIARTLEGVGRAMRGKGPRVRQGALTRQLDERERAQLFNVLGDPRGLTDAGLHTIDDAMVRGVRAPATSPQSEIDATGTVWIDVNSLLPRRYEFTYAAAGFGDTAFDLEFESTP
jgi:hypothetical protein